MNKWIGISLGTLVGVSHLGMIGIIASRQTGPDIPPVGPYTTFAITKDEDGYKMSYKANDPKTMYKTTSVDQKGLFKKLNKQVAEQYTMDGATHLGYAGAVGKTAAQAGLNVECIKAEGGGQSTGRVVGASIGAAAAPAVTGIPFIGPVLGGLVALGGADQGGKIGGQIATEFNEACDDPDTKSTD